MKTVTKQIYHRNTGLLEIECGRCGHEQEVEGVECGGYNPIYDIHEDSYFMYGSSADVCNECEESFGYDNDKVEVTKI